MNGEEHEFKNISTFGKNSWVFDYAFGVNLELETRESCWRLPVSRLEVGDLPARMLVGRGSRRLCKPLIMNEE